MKEELKQKMIGVIGTHSNALIESIAEKCAQVAIDHYKERESALSMSGVKARFSDENFITNVCLSYRHDYGLLGANERNLIRFECKEWLRAIVNNWDNTRTHVFPNVP